MQSSSKKGFNALSLDPSPWLELLNKDFRCVPPKGVNAKDYYKKLNEEKRYLQSFCLTDWYSDEFQKLHNTMIHDEIIKDRKMTDKYMDEIMKVCDVTSEQHAQSISKFSKIFCILIQGNAWPHNITSKDLFKMKEAIEKYRGTNLNLNYDKYFINYLAFKIYASLAETHGSELLRLFILNNNNIVNLDLGLCYNYSFLFHAIEEIDVSMVAFLIDHGANVNNASSFSWTVNLRCVEDMDIPSPLYFAICKTVNTQNTKGKDIIRTLLDNGAEIDRPCISMNINPLQFNADTKESPLALCLRLYNDNNLNEDIRNILKMVIDSENTLSCRR